MAQSDSFQLTFNFDDSDQLPVCNTADMVSEACKNYMTFPVELGNDDVFSQVNSALMQIDQRMGTGNIQPYHLGFSCSFYRRSFAEGNGRLPQQPAVCAECGACQTDCQ